MLDFGLAKALETEVSKQEMANSPTLTLEATREGIVLGTAAYMSPEQARGREVDKRTDIWSFGLVLFEMLTGNGMYAGKSFTETLAAVIHQEPRLEELPPGTPWKIRKLLERCLRKDSRMRLRDVGDARIAIHECLAGTTVAAEDVLVSPPHRPLSLRLAPWAIVPLLAVVTWAVKPDPAVPEKAVSRFELPAGEDKVIRHSHRYGLAFSPDGTQLAFVASSRVGDGLKIYLRSMDRWEVIPLQEGGFPSQLFFSPDGKSLGFHWWSQDFSEKKLKRLPLAGGPSTTICDCDRSFGASWGADDSIIFNCNPGEGDGGLWQVPASGEEPQQITEPDEEAGELSHRLPHFLPGARSILFTVTRRTGVKDGWSRAQIVVQSLETGERKVLIEGGSDARYVPTGHLVFARDATLMAAPFDLASRTLTGAEVPVLEGVSYAINTGNSSRETGAAQFAFSQSGSLAYIAGSGFPESENQLVWVDRSGKAEPVGLDRGDYHQAVLSPDGSTFAFTRHDDIWTYDLARGAESRQTSRGRNWAPAWTPDGRAISFSSTRTGHSNLFRKVVDSAAEAEPLLPSEHKQLNGSWSPDGNHLAFVQQIPNAWDDIWVLSMGDSPTSKVFVDTEFRDMHPAFSPNGRWLAYTSEESGRREVYVYPYPGAGRRITISTDGGQSPVWSGDGTELFYRSDARSDNKMFSVEIEIDEGELRPGKPILLFEGNYNISTPIGSYDVRSDGQRFLMAQMLPWEKRFAKRAEVYFGRKVSLVLNWFEELKRLVPTEK